MLSLLMLTALNSSLASLPPAAMPAFLTAADRARIVRLQRGRMLFGNAHRTYFLEEGRTQHNFPLELVGGKPTQRYLAVGVPKLALVKIADLICLKPPTIEAPDGNDAQSEAVTRIDRDSGFGAVLYEAVLTSGYQGDAFWQVMIRNDLGTPTGGAVICNVPADWCFPDENSLRPNGTYGRVVKQWLVMMPGVKNGHALRREIHEPGRVTNELWELGRGGALTRRLALDQLDETRGLPDVQETGVPMPLLQVVSNMMIDGRSLDDFDGMDSLIDQLNAAATQIARVLAKHADPKLGLPQEMFDENGNVRSTADAFAMTTDGKKPEYITWDARLDSAFKMLDWSMRTFLILTEVSPRLIGISEGAAPEAWKKLKLEAAPTLAKVARRILSLDRSVKDIWIAAHAAENAMVPGLSYEYAEARVTWRDGLPIDDDEQAKTLSELKTVNLISTARAVLELTGDPEQAVEEVAAIKAEQDAALPPSFQAGGFAAAAAG